MHLASRRPPAVKYCISAILFVFIFYTLNLNYPAWKVQHTDPTTNITSEPSTSSEIPKKLWYKLSPKGLTDELRGYVDSCININPSFESYLLTDEDGDAFVTTHFFTTPSIIQTYLSIRIPIIKADLLRYMILYIHGGIWNDLDVSCIVPIATWIPSQFQDKANLIVGLEFDIDLWVRQFATWTILAKPRSPHLLTVIHGIIDALNEESKEHGVRIEELKLDMLSDIVDFSGPRRLTRGVLKSLSAVLGTELGNGEIANVTEPRLIGDVLVLADCAFAQSMNEQYGDKKTGQVLVTHHYAGSWKNDFGGEMPAEPNR